MEKGSFITEYFFGKAMFLSVDRDADDEITDWKIAIRTSDAIKTLQEIIDQKTQSGDLDAADSARRLLQLIVEIDKKQKQNKS